MRYFKDKWTTLLYKLDHDAVYMFSEFDNSWLVSSYTPNEFLFISKQLSDGWFDLRAVSFIEITEAEAFIEIL